MKNGWMVSTVIVLCMFVIMFALVGALIGYVFGFLVEGLDATVGAAYFVAAAAVIAVICYFWPVSSAMNGMNAIEVDGSTEPRLYRVVSGLADKAGMPMPRVYVCDVDYPNAFACGRSPEKAYVAVTRPLLDMLNDDELEGVMGHEMSHIMHRDTIVMGTARTSARVLSTFAVIMGIAAMVSAAMLGSGSSMRGKNAGIAYLIMFVILIPVVIVGAILYVAVPGASAILKFGMSRSREYGADESSARITGKPLALANALMKLENACGGSDRDYKNTSAAPMMTVSPIGRGRRSLMNRLMSTHPPTEDRVRRLVDLDREMHS